MKFPMSAEDPWWKALNDTELTYVLFHLLGEVSTRDIELTDQLKTRMMSVATGSWKLIR